mmetsp:Transcript_13066/g.30877  ORF Transcript_13066/g.30877 Transcript_13066/m.30877 type:complete len:241 (+) Transcript_13066:2164-2886(+)
MISVMLTIMMSGFDMRCSFIRALKAMSIPTWQHLKMMMNWYTLSSNHCPYENSQTQTIMNWMKMLATMRWARFQRMGFQMSESGGASSSSTASPNSSFSSSPPPASAAASSSSCCWAWALAWAWRWKRRWRWACSAASRLERRSACSFRATSTCSRSARTFSAAPAAWARASAAWAWAAAWARAAATASCLSSALATTSSALSTLSALSLSDFLRSDREADPPEAAATGDLTCAALAAAD